MSDPRLVHDLEAVLGLPPARHRVLAHRLAEDVLDGHYGDLAQHRLAALLAPRRWRGPDRHAARDRLAARGPEEVVDVLRRLAC